MPLDNEQRSDSTYPSLINVLIAYAKSIENQSNAIRMLNIKPESELPVSKDKLRYCIFMLVLMEKDKASLELMYASYRHLDMYVPDEVYNYFNSTLGEIGTGTSDMTPEVKNRMFEHMKNPDFMEKFEKTQKDKEEETARIEKEIEWLNTILKFSIS